LTEIHLYNRKNWYNWWI